MGRYAQEFRRSLTDPEGFWGEVAKAIGWYQTPTTALDTSNAPFSRWYPDGVLNTCFNALDRHVRDGRGDQAALIYDSPVTGTQRTYTYTGCSMTSPGSPGCCAAWAWTRATG
jgi:propionyl-CoA synthetase